MPDVFSARFDLKAQEPEASVPREFLDAASRWLAQIGLNAGELSLEKGLVSVQANGHVVRWEPFAEGRNQLYELTLRHPGSSPQEEWNTQASLYSSDNAWRLSLRVTNNGPLFGQPDYLPTTRPRLLVHLANRFTLSVGDTILRPTVRQLAAARVGDFVRYELFESNRLPILVVTPNETGGYPVPPDEIAKQMLGTCEVVALRDTAATYELTGAIGSREMSCFRGAMRLYQPDLKTEPDPARHPLFFPPQIKQVALRRQIAESLARATVRRYVTDHRLLHLRDSRAFVQEADRILLEDRLRQATSNSATVQEWMQLASQYSEDLSRQVFDNEQQRKRIERLLAENQRLDGKVKALLYALREKGVQEDADDDELPAYEPSTVEEAVLYAVDYLADDLVILDSAIKSAADSPYAQPGKVLEGLKALAVYARARRSGSLGTTPVEYFRQQGFDLAADITTETRSYHGAEYRFTYQDDFVECAAHLRFGSSYDPRECCRIYFTIDEQSGKVIIGHVGRHLTSATTT